MDDNYSKNIDNLLSSRNPSNIIKQLNNEEVDALFTELRQHNLQLANLARQDTLTGLPNRYYFEAGIERLLAQAKRRKSKVAILFMDLDGFKAVNDTYGHAAGDLVLQQVASLLRDVLRKEDLIARFGGDEFVFALPSIKHYTDAGRVAKKIIKRIQKIYLSDCPKIKINASIGIAGFPVAGETAAILLKHADAALYVAKNKTTDKVQYHTNTVNKRFTAVQKVVSAIENSVNSGELPLVYLPVYSNPTLNQFGVIARFKALRQKNHYGMHEVFSILNDESSLDMKFSQGYLEKIYDDFQLWCERGLMKKGASIFVEVSQKMLLSQDFRGFLDVLIKRNNSFRKTLVLSILDSDGTPKFKHLMAEYATQQVRFCYHYTGDEHVNLQHYRAGAPDFININLSTLYGESDSAESNLKFLQGIIGFSDVYQTKILLTQVDTDDKKQFALDSGVACLGGASFSEPLSSKALLTSLLEDA